MNKVRKLLFAGVLIASVVSIVACSDNFDENNNNTERVSNQTIQLKDKKSKEVYFYQDGLLVYGFGYVDYDNRFAYLEILIVDENTGDTFYYRGIITWVGKEVDSHDGTVTDKDGNIIPEEKVPELKNILNGCLEQILA